MKALTVGAFGARGTGKTAWVKQWLRKHGGRRVMVFDYKADPSLIDLGEGHASWGAFVAACTRASFTARYIVSHDHDPHEQFAAFCELAWREGNLTMVVDELPEVTKANRAPPIWRKCVNVGRDYTEGGKRKALTIVGIGQRLAEVDKSFLDNCDIIHVGRLGYGCATKLQRMWGTPAAELVGLPDLHWREKAADRPEITSGVLSFAQKTPAGKARGTRP